MKKFLVISFSLLFSSIGFTQPPANITVYDCNGASKNIYNTLATGKSIIVAHKGVDCSICINSAPGWQTWAASNKNKVEVWGAITYTYNPAQFTPANMCAKTAQWVTTHNWMDIFTFPDSNRIWVNGGSPRYYVYSAIDSSIVYQGSNSTTARNTAIAQSVVGLEKSFLANSSIYIVEKQLQLKDLPSFIESVMVYNLKGQLVLQEKVIYENQVINMTNLKAGIYIAQFRTNDNRLESLKLSLN